MYSFHAMIHAQPVGTTPTDTVILGGRSFATLVFAAGSPGSALSVTFEKAVESLSRLPRMFVEPDGAFVWVGDQPTAWQIDGVLYDRDGRLLYVEVKGRCPAGEFDRFLTALGWPQTPLVFQLAREAVFLAEAEFRRFASGE